ncbi:MAG: hypothetical protein JWQ69_5045 [Pseudomonas sp.]|nr:hypothetical protein [Pseudomonas sp.]
MMPDFPLSPVNHHAQACSAKLPARVGLGLKSEHLSAIFDPGFEGKPDIGFFEVHAENYMVPGGPRHHYLGLIRDLYPLSLHGVGLSIGGEGPLDDDHLKRLAALLERYQPAAFSEHLAWSSHGPVFFNDLLPLTYDTPTLNRVCEHIDQVQSTLRRSMLLENPSTYLALSESNIDEASFIS